MIQSNQVRSALGALSVTQTDLASAVGVCRQTIARFIHGGNVSLETARRIEWFFRDRGVVFSDIDGKATITIEGETRYALDKSHPSKFDLIESQIKDV